MSDWDTILALAAGEEPIPEQPSSKKRRKVEQQQQPTTIDHRLQYHQHTQYYYLTLRFTKSLDGSCSQFVPTADGKRSCKACGRSTAVHILKPKSALGYYCAAAYCTIRNIRASLLLQQTKSCNRKALQRLCQSRDYPAKVLEAFGKLLGILASSATSDKTTMMIRGLITCDAAYYQLYYWDLTTNTATKGGSEPTLTSSDVPPPMVYFGEWTAGDTTTTSAILHTTTMQTGRQESRWQELSNTFGLSGNAQPTHVLEALHQLRMRESFSLATHLREDERLLQEWRDSCRDFLCHLYAYATLSSESLEGLRGILEAEKCELVELGAGTGYITKILEPIQVAAYDHRTDGTNEYHQKTPHFTTVVDGDAETVQLGDALILCYPPTDNNMAEVLLNRFRRTNSCKLFVHIGEFKGLTGTRAFERVLLQHFVCTKRWPCKSWAGSDASSVTMWIPKERKKESTTSLLVPCSWCSEKESKRRCRSARCFSYCSQSCYLKDSTAREHFSLLSKKLALAEYGELDHFEEI